MCASQTLRDDPGFLFRELSNSHTTITNEINFGYDSEPVFLMHPVISNSKKGGGKFFNGFNAGYMVGYLREIEELYNTSSFYQTLKLEKKVSSLVTFKMDVRLEYAKRVEVGKPDVKKWYDNTVLTCNLQLNDKNRLSFFGGGSISDSVFTSYGTSYDAAFNAGKVEIKNSLTFAYDYFYYWNQVGQNYVSDNLEFRYKDFTINTGMFGAVVDYNYVDGYDAKARNPNTQFNFDVRYRILPDPAWTIGYGFSARNYKYYSPLYFSPQNRKINGVYSYLYDMISTFYVYLGSGARVDNNNTFIWDFDAEAGYDHGGFSASLGISRYNDPYYTSYNSFLNITKNF